MIEVKKPLIQRIQERKKRFYEDGKKRAIELKGIKEEVRNEIKQKHSVRELK